MRLAVGARVTFAERTFVITEIDHHKGEVRFQNLTGDGALRLYVSELLELVCKGDASPWGQEIFARQRLPFLNDTQLDEEFERSTTKRKRLSQQREKANQRLYYVTALDRLGQASWKSLLFVKTLESLARARGDLRPPHPTTAYDWVRAYRNFGRDPQAFMRVLMLKRPRGPRDPALRDIVDGVIQELYRQGQPTSKEIQELVDARYKQHKAALAKGAKNRANRVADAPGQV